MKNIIKCLLIICTLLSFIPVQVLSQTIQNIAPGVDHLTYTTGDPNVIHVVRMDRSHHEYSLEMGFPQGKRNYSAKAGVTQIVPYYTYSGHTVIAAVNEGFFSTGIGLTGTFANKGNLIQVPNSTRETFAYTRGRIPLIRNSMTDNGGKIFFANGSSTTIDVLNLDRSTSQIVCYTPDWGTTTDTGVTGVEVIVAGVSYPFRADKEITGTVTAIKTGAQSTNNAIPINGLILSARDSATTVLLNNISVGDKIKIKWDIAPNIMTNADLMATGSGWILNNGAPVAYASSSFTQVNPRTAIAWNDQYIFLATIDGRQAGYSVGMSFYSTNNQVANFFTSIGATDCLNLDGGGSSTLVIKGALINCPSDNATTPCTGTERAVANAIMLVQEDKRSQFPKIDNFTSNNKNLKWEDKFIYSVTTSISPAAPDGDGYALVVKNSAGGYETSSLGEFNDKDYLVEASIFCDYRPAIGAAQYERVGIFTRDDGHSNFDATSSSTNVKGGNCYLMTYDTNSGLIRAGKMVNGNLTEFITPVSSQTSKWMKFKINCNGSYITYYLDDIPIATVTDTTHPHGFYGIGYHEYFTSNTNIQGTLVESFKVDQAITTSIRTWEIFD